MFVYLRIRWAYFNGLCFTVEVRRRLFLHQQLGAVDGGSQGTSLFFPRSQTMRRAKRSALSLVSPLTLTRPDKAFPLWSAHHGGYPAPLVNSFHLQSAEMTFHSRAVRCWWWTGIIRTSGPEQENLWGCSVGESKCFVDLLIWRITWKLFTVHNLTQTVVTTSQAAVL